MKEKASRNGYHMCVPAGHHDGGGEEEGGGHFRRVIKGEQNLECDAQDIIARIGNTEGKNKTNLERACTRACLQAAMTGLEQPWMRRHVTSHQRAGLDQHAAFRDVAPPRAHAPNDEPVRRRLGGAADQYAASLASPSPSSSAMGGAAPSPVESPPPAAGSGVARWPSPASAATTPLARRAASPPSLGRRRGGSEASAGSLRAVAPRSARREAASGFLLASRTSSPPSLGGPRGEVGAASTRAVAPRSARRGASPGFLLAPASLPYPGGRHRWNMALKSRGGYLAA